MDRDEELELDADDEGIGEETEALSANDTRIALAKRIVSQLKDQLENLEHLLESEAEPQDFEALVTRRTTEEGGVFSPTFSGRSIDGVFDGDNMVGEDGRKYLVPPNYASKSKLVEGDLLRLTINDLGKFVFKQKGPIERNRLVGMLTQDDVTGEWKVSAAGNNYRVLPAAVSFHKGQSGDDAVILVPKNAPSHWAALENIIKQEGLEKW